MTNNNEKVLIDTNILIYSLDKNSKYYAFANDIINSYSGSAYITSKNISEFIAVLSKNKNIDYKYIKKKVKDLTFNFEILFPGTNSFKIFNDLIEKYEPKGNLIYDIEVVSVMLASNIKSIATVNVKDFENIKEVEIMFGNM